MAFEAVNVAIFEHLQSKIDEDSQVREELKGILQVLEKEGRSAQSILSRVHSTPQTHVGTLVAETEKSILEQAKTIAALATFASNYPYYKYNSIWTRDIQNTVSAVLQCGWLGGLPGPEGQGRIGRLLTLDEVGQVLAVPVNLKERDAFHITIEEYLLSLVTLIDELARLAVNSVTLGDYGIPLQISQFIKDVHAGFQILNLKNDQLRRRTDSIKYSVKKVEDVVYDLSLRSLVPPAKPEGHI